MSQKFERDRNYHDNEYLKMIQTVFDEGFKVMDRTGTGTIGINGYQAIYDMSRHGSYTDNGDLVVTNFPLLTTKKMSMKNILVELLWFLRGDHNIKYLVDNGCNIWNDWPLKYYNQQHAILRTVPPISKTGSQTATMEEFIQAIKEDRDDFAKHWGELGPVYGKQWRDWEHTKYNIGKAPRQESIDQLALMVDQLKNNPYSRRIIVSAWNPADIEEMSKAGLPPCHMEFQAFVRPNPEDEKRPYIDLQMYQRSCDSFLGVPYNIASYAALLCLLAKECGYLPGKFIHQMGSVHIYLNHVEQMQEQLTRTPHRSPTFTIYGPEQGYDTPSILATEEDADILYDLSDFKISQYEYWPALRGEVAV